MSKDEPRRRSALLFFLLKFSLIFGLLIVPWPGWNQFYGGYFRTFAQTVYADTDRQVVRFGPNPRPVAPNLDTRMTLANRGLLDSHGNGPVRKTELDTRSIGWVPTALTISLITATPIPWRRRCFSLLGGLVMIHLFIWLSLQSWIWNEAGDLSLAAPSALWQRIAGELNYALLDQIGASFTVPVLIWVLVTFRQQDLQMAGDRASAPPTPKKKS